MPEPARRRELVSRLLSGSAGVVALCALAVSAYQAYLAREQQRMSAWPYVMQGNAGGDSTYARIVQNVGLGPALVRSVTVEVDGRRLRTWAELLDRASGLDSAEVRRVFEGRLTTSSVRRGMVLLPGTTTELLLFRGAERERVRGWLSGERVRMRVCYCSLYGDCWLSDTGAAADEPAPVDACPDRPADEFAS